MFNQKTRKHGNIRITSGVKPINGKCCEQLMTCLSTNDMSFTIVIVISLIISFLFLASLSAEKPKTSEQCSMLVQKSGHCVKKK